jgi:hypothetical protein
MFVVGFTGDDLTSTHYLQVLMFLQRRFLDSFSVCISRYITARISI